MSKITNNPVLQKYNTGLGIVARKGGSLGAPEAGLYLDGRDQEAPFVKDMSALSPSQFREASSKMDGNAKAAYLANKYPDFFARWNNGKGYSGELDGEISKAEIKSGGGLPAMISDLKDSIKNPLDLEMLHGLLENDGYTHTFFPDRDFVLDRGQRTELRNAVKKMMTASDDRMESAPRREGLIPSRAQPAAVDPSAGLGRQDAIGLLMLNKVDED